MKQCGQHDPSLKFVVAIVVVLSLAGCRGDMDRVKTLQAQNEKLQSAIADLTSRNSVLDHDINVYKSAYLAQADSNGSLQHQTGELAALAATLKGESNSLKKENSDLSGTVQKIQNAPHYDGVWQCDKGPDTDSVLFYRVLTSDSWALLAFNKSTNAIVMGKLGTYFVKDGIYQESVAVPTPGDKDKDSVTEFKIDSSGNGMSNDSEHWVRVNLDQ